MGPIPCYSQSQVVSVCQNFRPIAHFPPPPPPFFNMEKGYGHTDMLKTFPGDTGRKYIYIYIYGFVVYLQLFKHEPDDAQIDRLFILYSMDITCRSIAGQFVNIFIFLINKNIITLIIQKVQFNAELPLHCNRTLIVNSEGGLCPLYSASIYDPLLMKVASWDSTRDTICNTYIYIYIYIHVSHE